jgi:hypothetical protein
MAVEAVVLPGSAGANSIYWCFYSCAFTALLCISTTLFRSLQTILEGVIAAICA